MSLDLPVLGELTTEQYRQKIAGLIDPQEQQTPERRDEIKQLAIQFVALLPEVFGETLDRLTLWDRIGTGLQTAFAKTPGIDHEHFIQQVLEHIKSETSKAARCKSLAEVLLILSEWSPADRQAWIAYFHTHLVPIVVHAKIAWDAKKAKRTKKSTSPNAQPEGPNPFATEGDES